MNKLTPVWARSLRVLFFCAAVSGLSAALAAPVTTYTVTNLVSDDPGAHPAQVTDPGLQNAWGIAYGPSGPFWVSSNGAGTSPLYSVNPTTQATTKLGLTVTIPGDGSVTGQVFNGNAAAFHGDLFLFGSEDGTISGWRGALGSTAETLVSGSPSNVYKGVAVGSVAGNSYLYAANFRAGTVDVVKGDAGAPDLSGGFTDPNLPAGYAPFNVQNLGGIVYVTYAEQDATKTDEIAGLGLGLVDAYDLNGNLIRRVATGGTLDAPWGLALAPSSFGTLAGSLLVGNFGDGRISAFDPLNGGFLGQLLDTSNLPLSIDGLWAITPGNDGSAGSSQRLYFTAGPDGESHGLFGVLAAVPEPASSALLLVSLAALALCRRQTGRDRG